MQNSRGDVETVNSLSQSQNCQKHFLFQGPKDPRTFFGYVRMYILYIFARFRNFFTIVVCDKEIWPMKLKIKPMHTRTK